ncbi:MAG: MFS transporter [Actinomycetes bacterium]
MSPTPHAVLRYPLGGRLAYVVWGTGVLAYVVAVFHRYSLGVAGLQAAERFGVGASTLAVFSVLQLAVYAGMQIPVGVLLDRLGSRRILVGGAVLMAVGQVVFALAASVPAAVTARVLLGVGDAMTFTAVLRLVALWFPPRRNPLFVQLTGLLGQLGAIASAVPLVTALHGVGWTPTFLGAGALAAVVGVLVLGVLRDSPWEVPPDERLQPSLADVRASLRRSWAQPGTRLGLWTHFVTQFPMLVFTLLWGYPFLVQAQGLPPNNAGALLTTLTVAGMVVGPLLGGLVARHPFHRSRIVFGVVAVAASAWTAVLLWPGPAPTPLLVVLMLAMSPCGPSSMIGFDYARTFNPAPRLGSATGIVNVGGFVASLSVMLMIGLVLDVLTPGPSTQYEPSSFRWAFAVQYVVWALGLTQVWRYRLRARRDLADHDPQAYDALRRGDAVVPSHA